MPPSTEVPGEYAQLAHQITLIEEALRYQGAELRPRLNIETVGDLAHEALRAWTRTGSTATNELRVRANIAHGLAYAYAAGQTNWTRAIRASSANVDIVTPAPDTDEPSTLRLYALAGVNSTVLRLLEGSAVLLYETWLEAVKTLQLFGQINVDGIAHWKGVVATVLASLGGRDARIPGYNVVEHASLALKLLDDSSELRHLALHLKGRGNGKVPGTGWAGSNFRARRAEFSIHNLYHFSDQS